MEKTLFSLNEMGGVELYEVVDAYYRCRRHKRRTANAIRFEMDWQEKCVDLWEDINNGTYRPGRSIAFIVEKPVKREIFAADFRDRVVHHLIADKITGILEKQFIEDSYSTREGKGTLYGVRRIASQLEQISHHYTEDCWLMKIDIEGFFMSINKAMLFEEAQAIIKERYNGNDRERLLWLLKLTVKNRPEHRCVRKSPRSKWNGLPKNKSLFGTDGTIGLPIGNLTSQLLALLHLDPLDHLVMEKWAVEGYGRYVDDMTLIDHSPKKLMAVKSEIDKWLAERGHRLHPRKFYLQHFRKGVLFVGGMIKPGYILMGHRSVTYCMNCLREYNRQIERVKGQPDQALIEHFVASMNSYLGLMQQYRCFNLVHKIISLIHFQWYRYVIVVGKNGKYKIVSRPHKYHKGTVPE